MTSRIWLAVTAARSAPGSSRIASSSAVHDVRPVSRGAQDRGPASHTSGELGKLRTSSSRAVRSGSAIAQPITVDGLGFWNGLVDAVVPPSGR